MNAIMDYLNNHYLIRLILVVAVVYGLTKISQWLLRRFFEKTDFMSENKEKTIESIWRTASNYASLVICVVYAISPFVDLSKILAGAGVLGLVIGFGSQSLIKDMITGFFMMYDKQLKTGDAVTVNQKYSGVVEEVGIRALKIREFSGKLLTIANGEIKETLNGNVDRRRVAERIVASYRQNPKEVVEALQEICAALNAECADYLKKEADGTPSEPFQVQGVTSLNASHRGYEYGIKALVNDRDYFTTVERARILIAQTFYEKGIRMSEEQHFYMTRHTYKPSEN